VIFHELPLVNAGNDTAICRGDVIQLRATGTGTFLWSPADSLSDPGIFNPTADPTTTITYKVTLTDQYGCQNSDEIVIDVREVPVVDAGPDQVLDYLFSTALKASNLSANETGTWSVTSGTGIVSNSSSPATTVSGLSVGTNQFRWTVSNGACPSKYDLVSIMVNDLEIPSLITPNGDSYNEYFKLRGLQTLGKTELVIFDRRGAQVYKNSNYDNSWNGVDYNGNELPEDTYFYVINAKNGRSLSGYIVIKR